MLSDGGTGLPQTIQLVNRFWEYLDHTGNIRSAPTHPGWSSPTHRINDPRLKRRRKLLEVADLCRWNCSRARASQHAGNYDGEFATALGWGLVKHDPVGGSRAESAQIILASGEARMRMALSTTQAM